MAGSTACGVEVVVDYLLGHIDGEEKAAGHPVVVSAYAVVTLKGFSRRLGESSSQ